MTASPARSVKSFTLYDTCDTCTIAVYERVAIDGDLRALIITGEPTDEQLVDVKIGLLTEFAELSGDTSMAAGCNRMKSMQGYRLRLVSLALCLDTLPGGVTDEIKAVLAANGVNIIGTMDMAAIAAKIHAKLKTVTLQYREVMRLAMKKAAPNSEGMTHKDFNTYLAVLGKEAAGFRIPKTATLAELAGYINIYNTLKMQSHGKKH